MRDNVTSFPKHITQKALASNLDRARANFHTTLHEAFRNAVIDHARANGVPQALVDQRLTALEAMLERAEQTPAVTLIFQTEEQLNYAIREAAFRWWLHAILTVLDELPAVLGNSSDR